MDRYRVSLRESRVNPDRFGNQAIGKFAQSGYPARCFSTRFPPTAFDGYQTWSSPAAFC
jgi:hypothetical protein